jgi:hypothetical protein
VDDLRRVISNFTYTTIFSVKNQEIMAHVLKYEESLGKPTADGGMIGHTDFEQELLGTWKVDEMNLVIFDIGTGTGLIYNDMETVALKFARDIHTEGLNGQISIMNYVRSNEGL